MSPNPHTNTLDALRRADDVGTKHSDADFSASGWDGMTHIFIGCSKGALEQEWESICIIYGEGGTVETAGWNTAVCMRDFPSERRRGAACTAETG